MVCSSLDDLASILQHPVGNVNWGSFLKERKQKTGARVQEGCFWMREVNQGLQNMEDEMRISERRCM